MAGSSSSNASRRGGSRQLALGCCVGLVVSMAVSLGGLWGRRRAAAPRWLQLRACVYASDTHHHGRTHIYTYRAGADGGLPPAGVDGAGGAAAAAVQKKLRDRGAWAH